MRPALVLSCLIAAALTAPAAGPAHADVMPLRTPSGNIECSVGIGDTSDIICQIHERQGTPPRARPGGCRGAWGHNYELMEQGAVRMTCGGPGPRNPSPGVFVARYGTSERFGDITCSSSEAGFECRNRDGHGFMLSRRMQRVY